jgi:hypothetical protein
MHKDIVFLFPVLMSVSAFIMMIGMMMLLVYPKLSKYIMFSGAILGLIIVIVTVVFSLN